MSTFPFQRALTILILAALGATAQAQVVTSTTKITHTQAHGTAVDANLLPRRVRIFVAPDAGVDVSVAMQSLLDAARVPVEIHDIGQLARTEAALTAQLPRNADAPAAAAYLKERIAQGMAMESQLQKGWLAMLLVRQLGIQRVPAIVFDDRQVVYGESALDVALGKYQDARREGSQP